jgi:hypothetical protein
MTHPRHLTLARRRTVVRLLASVALGAALAAVIVVQGISASAAKLDPGPAGTAAAQLGSLRAAPVAGDAPPAVQAGLADGAADPAGVRLLGRGVAGGSSALYGAVRSNGGACNALGGAKGGVGTVCVDSLQNGISIAASDAGGWLVYGFAADDVVAVDVVVGGKPEPAQMLTNAYALALGARDLGEATALVVHHADGSAESVRSGLQAPPSA